MKPVLYIIIPCYNEEKVLLITCEMFLEKLLVLIKSNRIDDTSRIMFVDDGSEDETWNIIKKLAKKDKHYIGISQSRNRGHQNALIAGLMESRNKCDITITIDCDGQDDINAMDQMIDEYLNGHEIVYGVRRKRDTDTLLKKYTAVVFYKLLKFFGAEIVFNHADYRLLSKKVLNELENYKEVNLFLRGLVPLVGFKSTKVFYDRQERITGDSHYSLKKMLDFAFDGITSFSVHPIRMIISFGMFVAFLSFLGIIGAVIGVLCGMAVDSCVSMTCIMCFMGGIQLICLGIIGEYIGKIYMETKQRPRYIISERTWDDKSVI